MRWLPLVLLVGCVVGEQPAAVCERPMDSTEACLLIANEYCLQHEVCGSPGLCNGMRELLRCNTVGAANACMDTIDECIREVDELSCTELQLLPSSCLPLTGPL